MSVKLKCVMTNFVIIQEGTRYFTQKKYHKNDAIKDINCENSTYEEGDDRYILDKDYTLIEVESKFYNLRQE